MRKWLKAAVVAAVVAAPFTVGASAASAADCTDVGGVTTVCTGGMGNIDLRVPGVIKVCVRISSNPCGS